MAIIGGKRLRRLYSGIVTPFRERYEFGNLSGGLSRVGYDVALELDADGLKKLAVIPPNGFILASTVERFEMPDHLVGRVHDKSTNVRDGLAVQNTVIEPGWTGYLTLELTNHSRYAFRVERGMPIAQILFEEVVEADVYSGKYQDQERGPQGAR